MIRSIWLCQARKLIVMLLPIKVATIYNHTTYLHTMTIHILGRRVCHNIGSKLKWTTVNRRRECIIHDQWYPMIVCNLSNALDVQNTNIRIRQCLTKHQLGIRTESRCPLLIASILVDKGNLQSHLRESHAKQVVCSTIDTGGSDHMIACLTDIKTCKEVSSLARTSQHSCHTTLHRRDLSRSGVISRVLQTSIKVTTLL